MSADDQSSPEGPLAWSRGIEGPHSITRQLVRSADALGVGIKGRIPARFFDRLVEISALSADADTDIQFHLLARWDANAGAGGFIRVEGSVDANLKLVCQRCLESMTIEVADEFQIGIVRDEESAQRLPSELEPMLERSLYSAKSGRREELGVPILHLLEDELLLAIPAAPLHEEDCRGPAGSDVGVDQESESATKQSVRGDNPFAVLAQLKNQETSD